MIYILDSSALIEVLGNSSRAQKVHDILRDSPVVTTSISMHEVLAGALTEKDRFVIEGLFSTVRVLDHDSSAARAGALIEQELTRMGRKINKADILIAGICTSHHAELVTCDADFAKIKGFSLKLIT